MSSARGVKRSPTSCSESGSVSSTTGCTRNSGCFSGNRISVRFEYESRDAGGQWWRSHGNEHWEFDENGLMSRRDASINDYKIAEHERRIGLESRE